MSDESEARFLAKVAQIKTPKALPEKRGNSGDTLALQDIPLRCECGKRWSGPAFTPLASGETERLRTCADCCDATEARLTAKTEATRTPRKPQEHVRDAAPLRTAYKDD